MERRILVWTVFFVLLFNLFSTVYVLHQTEHALRAVTARASGSDQGRVGFCLNLAPIIIVPCNPNMSQDVPYTCQLSATDHGNTDFSFFVMPLPPDNQGIFNVSVDGLISFTPTNNNRGNHSVLLGVDDESGCPNAYDYEQFNFTVENINDPPYLIRAISHVSFPVNTTLFAFYLDDYFADPDDDPLTFAFLRGTADAQVNLTINPDSSVVFTSSVCGRANFQFVATDPGNLTANSNAIQVEVVCPPPPGFGGQEGTGGSGGGGGGGGAFIPCKPELVCLPWSECYPNGMRSQLCTDKNGCSDTEIRFYENCTYFGPKEPCEENWLCSAWSVCSIQGRQNRTCEDLNGCRSLMFRPPLEQACLYDPRCDDGVQNGDETGIDCGGPCELCRTIQQPTLLPGEASQSLLGLLLLLLLAVLLVLFILYRERIHEGLAELGWLLSRRRQKEALITPSEKRLLFEGIALLERDLPRLAVPDAYGRLALLLRQYYAFLLDLSFEFLSEELSSALASAKLSDELRSILTGFSSRLTLLESYVAVNRAGSAAVNVPLVDAVREEFRLLVCLTAVYSVEEVERPLPVRILDDRVPLKAELRARLLNAYEALQFLRVDAAKEEYRRLISVYELLSPEERSLFFGDVHRLYLEILYVEETAER